MKKIRIGIIGMGNIGRFYADHIRDGKVERCELTAVCSTSPTKLAAYKPLAIFGDARELMDSGLVDAVLIATPHYQHTELGIEAFSRGLHVLVEKPISAHKADAEKLIAARKQKRGARKPAFGAMFQLRMEPRYSKIRELIRKGELGEIVRVNWIVTDWFRTEAYYSSGGWRATWAGEGGGVLLNQAMHNLDMLCWLCGMPTIVRGFCQMGRYHAIEVEDNVTAYMEYSNGANGVFITSTGEAPGANRLEIAGTMGRVVLEKDKLLFYKNETAMTDFSKKAESGFAKPAVRQIEIPIENAVEPALRLIKNFVDHILDGVSLIAPGEEGLHSIELANMILYSSMTGKTVTAPLDSSAYSRKLNQLAKKSVAKKKPGTSRVENLAGTFSR